MSIENRRKYLSHISGFAEFDQRAIAGDFLAPNDRLALDTAIIGIFAPSRSFQAARKYLRALNK